MIFVVPTPAGLAEALRRSHSDDVMGCGSDLVSEAEYVQLRRPNLSRFGDSLADREIDDGTLGTVEEHRPGQTIWVEAARS